MEAIQIPDVLYVLPFKDWCSCHTTELHQWHQILVRLLIIAFSWATSAMNLAQNLA